MNKSTIFQYLFFAFSLLAIHVLSRQFLLFFNRSLFDLKTSEIITYIVTGIRFDLVSFAYANLLFCLFYFLMIPLKKARFSRIFLFIIWLVPNVFVIALNIFDAFYFPFVFRRSTSDIFSLLFSMKSDIGNIRSDLFSDFWPAFLLFILIFFFLILLYRQTIFKIHISFSGPISYLRYFIIFMMTGFLTVIAVRGGFQTKPVSLVTAGKYAPSEHTPLVLNSGFTFIRTFGKSGIEKKQFFEVETEMYLHFNKNKNFAGRNFQQKNVILIILESFSNEHLNSINDEVIHPGKNFAPFLDSLIHEGYFCTRAFANGKRSVEAVPAIISSVPTLMNTPFLLSPYINNTFYSLPQILRKKGYRSYFYHGGQNGTMNFDSYAYTAGFDKYSGKNEYPHKEDFDGKWGIWDQPYLSYVAGQLDQTEQPFFATIFTLSSHHPYNVPEKYSLLLPEGPLPIHKAIAYADMALKDFFKQIEHYSWYRNTLFIITSDHTAEPYLPYYRGAAGMYSIPLLFFDPGKQFKGKHTDVCQQSDIMPSVLDYLGYNGTFSAFGNSIFDTTTTGFNITYQSETYQLIADSIIIRFANDTPVKALKFHEGKPEIDDFDEFLSEHERIKKYIFLYQSFIQQYSTGLTENSIVYRKTQ